MHSLFGIFLEAGIVMCFVMFRFHNEDMEDLWSRDLIGS